jgi:alpha-D-xyloside xylohydrolase
MADSENFEEVLPLTMSDTGNFKNLLTASRRTVLGGGIALGAVSGVSAAGRDSDFTSRFTGYSRTDSGIRVHLLRADIDLNFATDGVISITKSGTGKLEDHPQLFQPAKALAIPVKVEETKSQLVMMHGELTASLDKTSGALRFSDRQGEKLSENPGAPAKRVVLNGLGDHVAQIFDIGADDALYGLGQFNQPFFNYRDKKVFLAHSNYDSCNPVLVSTGGWGLFWDVQTSGYFSSQGNTIGFATSNPEFIRYHVLLGSTIDDVIGGMRRLTGTAPLMGQWAYGYWQSKERYASQDELTGVVDEYRRRKIPFDNIVQDWSYWGSADVFSGMVWDKIHYPDPAAMTAHVHDQHAHVIISIWPAFGPKSDIYKEMQTEGLLFPAPHWSGGRVYDATSPKARDIYWRYVKEALLDKGMDGFWLDGTEPEFMSTGDRYVTMDSFSSNGSSSIGPIKNNLLTFPYYQSLGLYEHMRRDAPEKRPFLLVRKAYAGEQAFAATTWSGDVFASWGTLTNQIKAGLNFCLSGIPYWTNDIGGFFVNHRFPDALNDPAYKELYVRWFQFGAFMPIFRSHGTEFPREVWQFGAPGDEVYESLLASLRLRYELMPYIYSCAADVTRNHGTIMRALVMDFPNDRVARAVGNQFLFGHGLMVTIIDRPYFHAPKDIQEFVPNYSITGQKGEPAATVTFFEGDGFEKPVSQRLTDELKMIFFGDIPTALKGKPYSVRWTGRLTPQETGRHELVLTGKGGVRLGLNGMVALDRDVKTAAQNSGAAADVPFENRNGDWRYQIPVDMTAGKGIDFELTQRQPIPDTASTWVEWITPSQRQKMTLQDRKTVNVYVPEGRWYDWHSHKQFTGPGFFDFDVQLRTHPVLARAGAIIPTSPGILYAEQETSTLHIKVFAGADGRFELYEDAGDGNDYLKGAYALTTLQWDDKARTFRMGGRSGEYTSRVTQSITVEIIGKEYETTKRTFQYNGEDVTLTWS